jgi:hypothetical protein
MLLSEHLRRQRKRRTWTWWSRSTYGNLKQRAAKAECSSQCLIFGPFFHWFANQSLASTIPLPPDPNCTCNARWCHAAMKIWQRQLPDFMCVRTPRVVNFGLCFFLIEEDIFIIGGHPIRFILGTCKGSAESTRGAFVSRQRPKVTRSCGSSKWQELHSAW